LSNVLEWGIQPERQGLPEFRPPADGGQYAAEDMALYWSGDRKVVVTRHAMDALHVEDSQQILGYENLSCAALRAERPGNSLCSDLAADERALEDLAGVLNAGSGDGPISVEAYGSTPEYARLVARIRERSERVIDDRMTQERYLEFLPAMDSKIQAREFFLAALPGTGSMRLTRAFIARRGSDLLKFAQCALPVLGPVIVKADFAAGGRAMALFESADSLGDDITSFLPEGYDGDLLVEEYLGSGEDVLSVSFNGMVTGNGEIATPSAGRHVLYASRVYIGSFLGIGSMPPDCAEKVRRAGEAIGKVVASFGYRGPLNIDFLYRESDATIFPLEINPRRTLGASLSDICIQLFGRGYDTMVSAVARQRVPVHPSITKYVELRDSLLRKGLFGQQTKGLVILPYMVSSLAASSFVGLVVVGTEAGSAEAAFEEITHHLAQESRRLRSLTTAVRPEAAAPGVEGAALTPVPAG
jgi:hypothetical protein